MKLKFPFVVLSWIFSSCLFLFSNCQSNPNVNTPMMSLDRNRLSESTSPYLLQHAKNPVNWWSWENAALKHAQDSSRLIIVSIGYSSCHWCHVMEKESFEQEDVGVIMNKDFVSIKVDREERPDIDQIYMNAAILINGSGGWPLNVICTPDGNPIYAGTYFPKENWIKMLTYFSDMWETDPEKMIAQGEQMKEGIKNFNAVPDFNADAPLMTREQYDNSINKVLLGMDPKYGGKNGAPKFPMPSILEWFLSHSYYFEDLKSRKASTTTLDRMAQGGIYDALAGGFSRYSTDQKWHIPHFEKMLYDNAQLLSIYAKQYKITRNEDYKRIIEETYSYIVDELMDEFGLFYSSYDADSEGEEGKYYTWTYQEIESLLNQKQFELFTDYYGVRKTGNWEHNQNVFISKSFLSEYALKKNLNLSEVQKSINKSREILVKERKKRIKPGLDDKSILSWNALMIIALVDIYEATGEEKYYNLAVKSMSFIEKTLKTSTGAYLRIHHRNKSSISAFLDDYALVIRAKIKLYENSFEEKWLESALQNTKYVVDNFSDTENHMFFYNDINAERLIVRNKETSDNVIPASNSIMAQNLFLLGHFFYKPEYIDQSQKMLQQMTAHLEQNPSFHSNWMQLYLWSKFGIKEVAISGSDALILRKDMALKYYPNAIFLGDPNGKSNLELLDMKYDKELTRIFVCKDKACLLPTSEIEIAAKMIQQK